ncbi:hypothetical protein C0U40_10990 [Amylibacter cionae]|nr:hypothetical protein C0U40_10990 [Amylibacter cionae]
MSTENLSLARWQGDPAPRTFRSFSSDCPFRVEGTTGYFKERPLRCKRCGIFLPSNSAILQ